MKKALSFLLVLVLSFSLFTGCSAPSPATEPVHPQVQLTAPLPEETLPAETAAVTIPETTEETESLPDYDGTYTSKEDVALYLHIYGQLPQNFISKKEARNLGWSGGSVESYAPGMCIGGDRFGNYEGLLPDDREYLECDIDTLGKESRGAKRIVFSEDGLIYYTDDHYESFELLYGEP